MRPGIGCRQYPIVGQFTNFIGDGEPVVKVLSGCHSNSRRSFIYGTLLVYYRVMVSVYFIVCATIIYHIWRIYQIHWRYWNKRSPIVLVEDKLLQTPFFYLYIILFALNLARDIKPRTQALVSRHPYVSKMSLGTRLRDN